MKFEGDFFEGTATRAIENADRERIIRKAEKVIKEHAIDPNGKEFVDYYGERNVERDNEHVRKAIMDFERNDTDSQKQMAKIAKIFEAIILEHGELSDWFGPNSTTFKTSLYDDIENGVDTIVEFSGEESLENSRQGSSHLALAIDETFSTDIRKKFLRIRERIDKGDLAEIKYFMPEDADEPGLKNLPLVVIGADMKAVEELGELWLEGKNRDLGKHQIQFQILEELLIQLETFGNYAENIGNSEIAGIYRKAYNTIKEIWDDKQKMLADEGIRDSVFQAVKYNLDLFK